MKLNCPILRVFIRATCYSFLPLGDEAIGQTIKFVKEQSIDSRKIILYVQASTTLGAF